MEFKPRPRNFGRFASISVPCDPEPEQVQLGFGDPTERYSRAAEVESRGSSVASPYRGYTPDAPLTSRGYGSSCGSDEVVDEVFDFREETATSSAGNEMRYPAVSPLCVNSNACFLLCTASAGESTCDRTLTLSWLLVSLSLIHI